MHVASACFLTKPAAEIAKSLNIHPDPPTPSPRTALFLKRKFEQCSDSESDGDEGEERRPEPPVGRSDDVQGERVCVDETVSSRDPLFDRPVAGYPEMSGALQDLKGDDESHPCSGD